MTRSPQDDDDERRLSRRRFLETAATFGAVAVLGCAAGLPAAAWRGRRDLYPEGVASGDLDAASLILWTRRPWSDGRTAARLIVDNEEQRSQTRGPQRGSRVGVEEGCSAAECSWTFTTGC